MLNKNSSSIKEDNENIKMNRSNLKIAVILDEFSYECLKYECQLILVDTFQWENLLIKEKPDLLFVESAWMGNDKVWQYKVTKKNKELIKLIKWCNSRDIPTIFWNKEDPVFFHLFIETAKLFDYIFTTDADSISKYKEIVGHNRVYFLHFAAQPKIHNPMNKDKEKIGKVAFAGAWYNRNLPHRKKDMEIVIKPALKYGLHIYDRFHNIKNYDYYQFPQIYQPHIQGSIPYQQMKQIYKKYDLFLNVNSVENSTTMFSRRVFELLACGINIVSGYSKGIEQMFPGIVKQCKTKEDTLMYLDVLLNNKELRDRLSLLGQREVFHKHTYSHRIEEVLDKIGLKVQKIDQPGVSLIACTNRTKYMENLFENYIRQNYEKKELIIVLSHNLSLEEWQEKVCQYDNVKVFQPDEEKSLGWRFNFGVNQSNYEFVAKFDDDDYYGFHYLTDAMNAFKYTDAGVIGKCASFIYFESNKILAVRFPNKENCYVKHVTGPTMIIKKKIFDKIRFTDMSLGEDTQFIRNCIQNGIKIYATDRFNHTYIRHKCNHVNTWKIDEEAYLKKCEIVAYTNDYKTHVTV